MVSNMTVQMNCFGEIVKISTTCDDSFARYHRRYVSCRRKNDKIIVTESANLVTKYDINQKHMTPIQSWSFEELNKLCVPMLFDDRSEEQRFIGLHSFNTLIEWTLDRTTNQLCQVFKKTFTHLIIDILWPRYKQEPLLIFSNGWIELLDRAKMEYFVENVNNSVIEKDEKIIGIENTTLKKGRLVVYYIVSNEKENLFVYKCSLNKNLIKTMEKSPINRKLDSWTFYSFNGTLIGATKEDSDHIQVFSLEPPIKNSRLFKFDQPSFKTLCSMAICESGAICFLGKKSDDDFVVDVYETNYSIKISSLNLNLKTVLPNAFCAFGDNIFITSKNNIVMVPIVNQKPLLSQLLTKSLTSILENDNNVKTENYKEFKRRLGIPNIDSDEPLSIQQIKEMDAKIELISKHEEIPEEIIVSLFDFCTKNYIKLINSTNDDLRIKELKIFFNKLVKLPYNEVFLVSCLKSSNIQMDQYLLSIELLLDLLPCNSCFLLTWISVLLDANYSKFIISPSQKTIEALHKIYNRICQNIEFFQELGTIKSLIESITKRERSFLSTITNESKVIGQYSIELLTFT